MRHLAVRHQLHTQRSLRCDRQPVFRGLAVDEKFHAARLLIGRLRALAVALLSHQKEQADVNAFGLQLLGRCDLGHDDALGVA